MAKFKVGDEVVCVKNRHRKDSYHGKHEAGNHGGYGAGWEEGRTFTVYKITGPFENCPIYWDRNEVTGVFGCGLKLSDKKAVEDEFNRLKKELEKAQAGA